MNPPDNPFLRLRSMPPAEALDHIRAFYHGLRLEKLIMLEAAEPDPDHIRFLDDALRQLEQAMPSLKEPAQA